jgi:acyl carrier protein
LDFNSKIKKVLVVARSNDKESAHKYLECYFSAEETISVEKLRLFLSKRLPAYMVPTLLIQLDKMPTLISGKIDRSKILAPVKDSCKKHINLSTHASMIIETFSKILNINPKEIDVNDDFFSLGGDSIQSIQASQYCSKHFHYTLSVVDIYKYRTPRLIASKNRKNEKLIDKF